MKKIGFYLRANSSIGFGHLSRAVSLASSIERLGHETCFFSEDDLRVSSLFRAHGGRFERMENVARLPSVVQRWGCDGLVVDTPIRDERFLGECRSRVSRLLLVDDWDADCVGPNILVNGHVLWDDSVIRRRRQTALLGLKYALLDPAWSRARGRYRLRRRAERVLITMGGSDPRDLTSTIVPLLSRVLPDARLTLVLGPGYRGALNSPDGTRSHLHIERNVRSLMPLALQSDVAVSAVGVTMYELAVLGVPMVLVDEHSPHRIFMESMEARGMALWARTPSEAADHVRRLISSPALRRRLHRSSRARLDGRGARRVAEVLCGKPTRHEQRSAPGGMSNPVKRGTASDE